MIYGKESDMLKDKLTDVRDFIVNHSKIIFPVFVVAVVAFTVVIALNLNQEKASAEEKDDEPEYRVFSDLNDEGGEPVQVDVPTDVPLVANEDSAVHALINTYYNAWATGDMETLASVYDEISGNDLLQYQETSRYLEKYTALEIYTKQGLTEGSVIAYVYYRVCFTDHEDEFPGYETMYICSDEQGQMFIKNENNFTQEERDYITTVSGQDDVREFNNRVTAEYNALMMENSSLLLYLEEVGRQVEIAMGVALAQQNVDSGQEADTQEGAEGNDQTQEGSISEPQEPVQEATPEYAIATTTVNVRSSDSEKADKLGKVTQGTRLQVQEVRINGWTKVLYQGKDGYIKSDYLQYSESVANQEVVGTVTATTLVNIRAAADETAERLGQLPAGESLNLLAVENGWCKVAYNNQAAYVKADYVEQH